MSFVRVGGAHQGASGVGHRIHDGRDGALGDELTGGDDDQVVGEEFHLGEQMAGDQDGASLGGEGLEEIAHPADALGVQSVGRLVEDQNLRIADQRGGDAEPLAHTEGIALELAVPRPV